ncbi:MAG: hypothetical protein ACKVOJ_05165 [Sphingomonadaceae bacterium]
MMMRSLLISIAVLSWSAAATAQTMPLSTFLAKAEGLRAKGPLALMSSDLPLIKAEVKGSLTNYRTSLAAQKAAGKPLDSCPPAKGALDSDEMMAFFGTIPAAQRSKMTVQAALFSMMKKKYPCSK